MPFKFKKMKLQEVNLETSISLQKVGFNEPTIAVYDSLGKLVKLGKPTIAPILKAPTQALAQMWLREKCKLIIEITYNSNHIFLNISKNDIEHDGSVRSVYTQCYTHEFDYESIQEDAIQKACQIILEEKK